MRTNPIIGKLGLALVCLAFAIRASSGQELSPDADQSVLGNSQFAFDLYRELAAADTEGGNLLFSPYNISTAFAMTYAGARGQTAAEMADVMQFTLPQDRLHPAMGEVIDSLNSRDGYELAVANRLWGQVGFNLLPDFLATTQDNYGAELAQLDFFSDPEAARREINQWTEDQTRGRIEELFKPGDILRNTRLALTNAVFFRSDWKVPFDPQETRPGIFTTLSSEQVTGPMMHMPADDNAYRLAGLAEATVLELPYRDDELSMLIALPGQDGLPSLEQAISPEWLEDALNNFTPLFSIDLMLPRFRITGEFRLNDTLSTMGMPSPFSSADFSGITNDEPLHIQSAVHEAFMEVNELGSEAAGATGISSGALGGGTPRFYVNRPFMFMI